jgi:hypothetical protein
VVLVNSSDGKEENKDEKGQTVFVDVGNNLGGGGGGKRDEDLATTGKEPKENVEREVEMEKVIVVLDRSAQDQNEEVKKKETKHRECFNDWKLAMERRIKKLSRKKHEEKKRICYKMELVYEEIWRAVRLVLRSNGFFLDEEDDEEEDSDEGEERVVVVKHDTASGPVSRRDRFKKFLEMLKEYLEKGDVVGRSRASKRGVAEDGWYTVEEDNESDADEYKYVYDERNVDWTWRKGEQRDGGGGKGENATVVVNVEKLKHSRPVQRVFRILDRAKMFTNKIVQTSAPNRELRIRRNIRYICLIFNGRVLFYIGNIWP